MMRSLIAGLVLGSLTLLLVGCGKESPEQKAPGMVGSDYLLTSEPAGAKNIVEARKDAKDKEDVVLVGRIGGHKEPWIKDRASFLIADLSMVPCNEIEGDACTVPWDYCCEVEPIKKTALVKVVDEEGKLLKEDARTLLNLKELQTVVVQGQAQRDEEGNLTVLARKVYVRK